MKVLMLGWEYPPFLTGGLGTHCYNLVRCLADKGLEITFLMPAMGEEVQSLGVKIVQAGRQKIIQIASRLIPYKPSLATATATPSTRFDKYGFGFFEEVKKFTQLASEIASQESFDLIHCHDWMTFPAGVSIKRQSGKPLVVTVHSTEHNRTGYLSPNAFITDVEWNGMYYADKIITVSNYMKEDLRKIYQIPLEKVSVVYNGVEYEKYQGPRVSFGLKEKVVLFLGRLTLQKGPDYFLQAAKRVIREIPNTRFIIAGAGDMFPSLIDMSISLGISDKVAFTGYCDRIEELYRMADLYVMPSVSDPFGITALEAMSAGTPVIVSKTSGVSEAVRHRITVDFWDIDQLASKIIGVLKYKHLRSELASNGSREVSSYTWGKVADKTLSVYSKLFNT